MMPVRRLLPILLLCAAMPATAAAQLLRVHATEEVSGRPAAGAVLELLDSTGTIAAQVVLSAAGRREIILTAPGTFRARVRRIGYPPFVSAPVHVRGGTVDLPLVVPARRVALAPVEVTAARCASDAFTNPAFAALWDEVHTALTSTSLGHADADATFEMRMFRRGLDRERRPRATLVGPPRLTSASRPFTAIDARELARDGYVQMTEGGNTLLFHGPDEDVLRSDEFIARHCFAIVRGSGETAGLFGVRFTPASTRDARLNEIAGTMWIDSASAELRHVDFHFIARRLPPAATGEGRSGGQVVFQRLASGRWIVGAWRLRMPRFTAGPTQRAVAGVGGYDDYGGVITPLEPSWPARNAAYAEYHALLAPGVVEGIVVDSLAGRPLANAAVWLVPITLPGDDDLEIAGNGMLNVAPASARTDADGRWRVSGVPPGAYRLGFEHPSVDSLGIVSRRPELRLAPGARLAVDLFVPTLNQLTAECDAAPGGAPASAGIVLGTVRMSDRRPVGDGLIRIGWSDVREDRGIRRVSTRTLAAPTEADGTFRLCGVPTDRLLGLQVATAADSSDVLPTDMQRRPLRRMNVVVARDTSALEPYTLAIAPDTASDTLSRSAEADPHSLLAAVHWRRVGGRSRPLVGDAVTVHATFPSLLDALAGARSDAGGRIGGPWALVLRRAGRECRARVFLDGHETTYEQIQRLRPAELLALELFASPELAPLYAGGAPRAGSGNECGALLLWTGDTASAAATRGAGAPAR